MSTEGQPVASEGATPRGLRVFAVAVATVVFFILYLVLVGVLSIVSKVGEPGKLIFSFWIIGSYVSGAVAYFAAHFLATGIAKDHSKKSLSAWITWPLFLGLALAIIRLVAAFFFGAHLAEADFQATVAFLIMFALSVGGVESMQKFLN